jgi:hypothetical protein
MDHQAISRHRGAVVGSDFVPEWWPRGPRRNVSRINGVIPDFREFRAAPRLAAVVE